MERNLNITNNGCGFAIRNINLPGKDPAPFSFVFLTSRHGNKIVIDWIIVEIKGD